MATEINSRTLWRQETGEGILQPSQFLERGSQVEVVQRLVRSRCYCPGYQFSCLFMVTGLVGQSPQQMIGIGVIWVDIENLTIDRLRLLHPPCQVQPNPILNKLRNSMAWNRAHGFSKGARRTVVPLYRGSSCQCLLVTFGYSIHRPTYSDSPPPTIAKKQLAER